MEGEFEYQATLVSGRAAGAAKLECMEGEFGIQTICVPVAGTGATAVTRDSGFALNLKLAETDF